MKKAFTMIELIFVIVIIGILAALATPKLAALFGQAKGSKILAYAGTLQRTTIPPYWSESIISGNGGSIAGNGYPAKIMADLDWPTDFETANGGSGAPDFAAKLLPTNEAFNNGTAPTKTLASATINGITYSLACTDGNKSSSPKCDVYDGNKWILQSNR